MLARASLRRASQLPLRNGSRALQNYSNSSNPQSSNSESEKSESQDSIVGKVKSNLGQTKKLLHRIGTEDTKESEIVLKYIRRFGMFSILVVFASIGYASAYVGQPKVEQEETIDLSKDIRQNSK
ncbi:hypothetical protein G9P44_004794 [Scheffersomyces stipitis]|nr:hypothetical protein G9P44_004794 [Scheffersomyces stipitis]